MDVFLLDIALIAVGIGMAIVAARMIRLPKRNIWQKAWLILVGVLTIYPGLLTLSALNGAISVSIEYGVENEMWGWAYLGLTAWIGPIAATYLVGKLVALLRRVL